jgi:hypothetical protein
VELAGSLAQCFGGALGGGDRSAACGEGLDEIAPQCGHERSPLKFNPAQQLSGTPDVLANAAASAALIADRAA